MRFAAASARGKDRRGRAIKAATTLFSRREDGVVVPGTISHAVQDPSFLAVSTLHKVLYVASENSSAGRISALRMEADGGLTLLGSVGTGGQGAVHLAIDQTGRWLAAANYRGERRGQDLSVAVVPIRIDGIPGIMAASASHEGSGPDKERQEGPHTHCVMFSPDNKLLAAVDLGTDGLWLYHFDAGAGSIRLANEVKLPAGCGPRHCVFHPSKPLVYICGELDSTLMTLRYDAEAGTAELVDTDAATGSKHEGRNYPSGLAISPDGHYLMLANRGADTIATFWVDPETGMARLRDEVPCGGKFPRAIRLDATGRSLAVANQRSGNVVLFDRDFETGKLSSEPVQVIDLPSAMDVIFLD